jgi:hypothetical protein
MSAQRDSWNDGAARSAIVDFVTRGTTSDGPAFVPPADRIAVFDSDGTVWCEHPVIQFARIMQRWEEMAQQSPAPRDQQPWTASVEKHWAWFRAAITRNFRGRGAKATSDTPAGRTPIWRRVRKFSRSDQATQCFPHRAVRSFDSTRIGL